MKTLETSRLILRDWNSANIGCGIHTDEIIRYLIEVKNNYAVVMKKTDTIIGTIRLDEDGVAKYIDSHILNERTT